MSHRYPMGLKRFGIGTPDVSYFEYLHGIGCSVYCVRLPGHGTVPKNLTEVTWKDWYHAYLRGYAVIKNCCKKVVLGGFSTGGILALLTAAGKEDHIHGVFSVNSPIDLKCINARKSVAANVLNDILEKFNIENSSTTVLDSTPENPDIN